MSRSWLFRRGVGRLTSSLHPVAPSTSSRIFGGVSVRLPPGAAANPSLYSTAPLPHPTPEGAAKDYSPKIVQIVDEISQMTILEVADLNELLKKKLNIQDVPMMAAAAPAAAAGAAAAAPAAEEEVEAKPREKTIFTVKLASFDAGKKVALIKEVKNLLEGMNLVQAKKFVESAPQTLKEDVPKDEAEALKAALEAVGAVVEME